MMRDFPTSFFLSSALALGMTLTGSALAEIDMTTQSQPWTDGDLTGLSVCWEHPGYSEEKAWVASVIEREYAAKAHLFFIGWSDCAETPDARIRLGIFDFPTHTKGMGRAIDGMHSGITLNFTFSNWNRQCQMNRRACIEGLAVHEFGHAAGLPDALIPYQGDEGSCVGKSIAHLSALSFFLDDRSIMNDCNNDWHAAALDEVDVAALVRLYP
ncbi:MAG: hypothetical protein NTZ90_09940 [Proteobacteria bacterium]|nr:hypothetical protein [Pseudomonadota bacterium]